MMKVRFTKEELHYQNTFRNWLNSLPTEQVMMMYHDTDYYKKCIKEFDEAYQNANER